MTDKWFLRELKAWESVLRLEGLKETVDLKQKGGILQKGAVAREGFAREVALGGLARAVAREGLARAVTREGLAQGREPLTMRAALIIY